MRGGEDGDGVGGAKDRKPWCAALMECACESETRVYGIVVYWFLGLIR